MVKNTFDLLWRDISPFAVGFDRTFDTLSLLANSNQQSSNYPPYNIRKISDNDYKIEVALAGYSKDDIELELKDSTLTVRNKQKEKVVNDVSNDVIHKGISTRQFERAFTISEDIKVKNAELQNGLLNIVLERIVPEEKKARLINII